MRFIGFLIVACFVVFFFWVGFSNAHEMITPRGDACVGKVHEMMEALPVNVTVQKLSKDVAQNLSDWMYLNKQITVVAEELYVVEAKGAPYVLIFGFISGCQSGRGRITLNVFELIKGQTL